MNAFQKRLLLYIQVIYVAVTVFFMCYHFFLWKPSMTEDALMEAAYNNKRLAQDAIKERDKAIQEREGLSKEVSVLINTISMHCPNLRGKCTSMETGEVVECAEASERAPAVLWGNNP